LVRKSVVSQVKSLGYAIRIAASGAEALELVKRNVPFDLLFTDVVMPGGINGQQLAREIAKRRPGIKVLYTSGYTESAMPQDGQPDAGGAMLQKPYRKTDLALKLREMLRTRNLVE
jgi:CheY-like chemotaxis protein